MVNVDQIWVGGAGICRACVGKRRRRDVGIVGILLQVLDASCKVDEARLEDNTGFPHERLTVLDVWIVGTASPATHRRTRHAQRDLRTQGESDAAVRSVGACERERE